MSEEPKPQIPASPAEGSRAHNDPPAVGEGGKVTSSAPIAAAAAPAPEPLAEPEPPKLPPALPGREFSRRTRREILKLTPLVLAGAFTSMALRDHIFNNSLGFT